MALVILPCDLPWWSTLQTYLERLRTANNVDDLIKGMLDIHVMCNVGLDPDEPDAPDLTIFDGLKTFLLEDYAENERTHFFTVTLPSMVDAALSLKSLKPINGLQFSLQQQVSYMELNRSFVRSLIAHCFFSTLPKRTNKTHPTLQDFNFTYFFNHLNQKFQKAKLTSFFYYFDLTKDQMDSLSPNVTITRQVMTGIEWLTIDDWLECSLPLCPLVIKHECRMENADVSSLVVCFSSKKIGGKTLNDGSSKECIQFMTHPELLVTLLCVEALEDNETVIVEGVLQTGRINSPRQKGIFESTKKVNLANICCMDAENYSRHPLSQYEEDNVLRELNKALLGFRQKQQQLLHRAYHHHQQPITRRLSPIGESISPTPIPDNGATIESSSYKQIMTTNKRRDGFRRPFGTHLSKGRFIILGSSGEMLPVTRNHLSSEYSSCHSEEDHDESSPEEYFTACTSIPENDNDDVEDEEGNARRYSGQLDTVEHRAIFAERLKEALRRAQSNSTSDSSYAVDISVSGSNIADPNIRMKRGGSRGFMLEEDSTEESVLLSKQQSMPTEDTDVSKNSKNLSEQLDRRNKGGSSKYSFSTDYNSDLDSVYEQLNEWLEETEDGKSNGSTQQQQRLREHAVIQFAGGLLKRTLSESFVGVPFLEGDDASVAEVDGDTTLKINRTNFKVKMAARSLSLELAKHKHKLAAQLIAVIGQRKNYNGDMLPIVTGNWGCGSRNLGDPQMKLLIQWMAASVAGVPCIVYYTCSNQKLLKLDTVCRVLLDRRWSVGELIKAALNFTEKYLSQANSVNETEVDVTLFDCLMNTTYDKIDKRYKSHSVINNK